MPGDPLGMSDGLSIELVSPDGSRQRTTVQAPRTVRVHRMLSEHERARRPRVAPVRDEYLHLACGTTTRMGRGIAETFAIDPTYYSTTYCVACACYLPVAEFRWVTDGSQVGVIVSDQ